MEVTKGLLLSEVSQWSDDRGTISHIWVLHASWFIIDVDVNRNYYRGYCIKCHKISNQPKELNDSKAIVVKDAVSAILISGGLDLSLLGDNHVADVFVWASTLKLIKFLFSNESIQIFICILDHFQFMFSLFLINELTQYSFCIL